MPRIPSDRRCCAGPWRDAVRAFEACGHKCPQYTNPTDYFMRVVSDADSHDVLVAAQAERWSLVRADAPDLAGQGAASVNASADAAASAGLSDVKVQPASALTTSDLSGSEVRYMAAIWLLGRYMGMRYMAARMRLWSACDCETTNVADVTLRAASRDDARSLIMHCLAPLATAWSASLSHRACCSQHRHLGPGCLDGSCN